jgi:hypothetical protein
MGKDLVGDFKILKFIISVDYLYQTMEGDQEELKVS